MKPGPFRIGEVVWAKVKGYPQWPACVLDPREGADVKNPRKKNAYFVRFFSAEPDKVQVSWLADDDLVTFPLILDEMRAASEMKGGKTYTDLRKCIASANKAYHDFLENMERNPDAALQLAIALPPVAEMQPSTSALGEVGAPRGRPKATKKETPRTPILPKPAPDSEAQTPASGKRSRVPKAQPAASPVQTPATNKRVPKKRVYPDDEHEQNGFSTPAAASKRKATTPAATKAAPQSAGRKSAVKTEARGDYGTVGLPMQSAQGPSTATLKQAREISVGFIGLEDLRALQAARRLLDSGVQVRVWAKTQLLAKDLEYSGAERISEAEKIFEETDVVFVSAGSNYDLSDLLSGADHLIRKIRPQGKNKIKGVCVFSSMSKQDSELTARKLEAKNIKYLECAWTGSAERASLVCCRSEELFKHCKPVLDIVCGESVFLGQDFGVALAAKAYLSIVEGVHLAGMVEAGYLAQSTGLDISLLQVLLPFGTDARISQILQLPEDAQNKTSEMMREQYRGLRDAVHLAHPVQDGVLDKHSSVTHMASFAMDLFKSHFIMYRAQRDTDEERRGRTKTEGLEERGEAAAASPTKPPAVSAPVNGPEGKEEAMADVEEAETADDDDEEEAGEGDEEEGDKDQDEDMEQGEGAVADQSLETEKQVAE